MKAALVIMAAGLGSRYGGNKQVDGVGPQGEMLMEYSIYDAVRAGFTKVVFIIKPDMRELMDRLWGDRTLITKTGEPLEVCYAMQDFTSIPDYYTIPAGRTKPFGTAHAVLCARPCLSEPFCVINADDYYGVDCFRLAYEALCKLQDDEKARYVMVGYQLRNTLTDNGHVSRGVCTVDGEGYLTDIHERTHIIKTVDGALYTEDEQTYHKLHENALVSMNLWGFTPSILDALAQDFAAFLSKQVPENPLKAEFYLPAVVSRLLQDQQATVQVLPSPDKWYGVTYQADKPVVKAALLRMAEEGLYPKPLWGNQ